MLCCFIRFNHHASISDFSVRHTHLNRFVRLSEGGHIFNNIQTRFNSRGFFACRNTVKPFRKNSFNFFTINHSHFYHLQFSCTDNGIGNSSIDLRVSHARIYFSLHLQSMLSNIWANSFASSIDNSNKYTNSSF